MIIGASSENIARAASMLGQGEVVAFPTETVYGLGANAFNENALAKIYEIKGRPRSNPLIVHISSMAHLDRVAKIQSGSRISKLVQKLGDAFWPGPLTLVLPKQPGISKLITSGQDSVGIRVPRHPVALALIDEAGFPIAAPSANKFKEVSPTTAQHVADSLGEEVPIILDGGPCEVGLESTIISLMDAEPVLLRAGGIPTETIESLIGPLSTGKISQPQIIAPGMLREHYAPSTPIRFFDSADLNKLPPRIGLIVFSSSSPLANRLQASHREILSISGNESEIASRLFAAIRKLDSMQLDLILVDSCAETGLGRAIMDRLRRATARFCGNRSQV